MIIKEMTADHIPMAAEIEKLCFVHPWSEQSIKDELERQGSVFLMAFESDVPVGYVGMSAVIDEGYIGNIAVIKEYRQKGIGKALMQKLIELCINRDFAFVTLEVRESNVPAINLYKKFGFESVGIRKNYYKEPLENALLLTKYFKENV